CNRCLLPLQYKLDSFIRQVFGIPSDVQLICIVFNEIPKTNTLPST
ncbi:MAG: hypothetical protein ACI9JR_002906, partial [Gammaproteobacteria bacterium]